MKKIFCKHFFGGLLINLLAAIGISIIMFVLYCSIAKAFIPFNTQPTYVFGSILGILGGICAACFLIPSDNEETVGDFWLHRLNKKKFVKTSTLRATVLPNFILGLILVSLMVLFYGFFSKNDDTQTNDWIFILCLVLSFSAVFEIFYGFVGMINIKGCKCGYTHTWVRKGEGYDSDTYDSKEEKKENYKGGHVYGVYYKGEKIGTIDNTYEGDQYYERDTRVTTWKQDIVCANCGRKRTLEKRSTTPTSDWRSK